MIPISSTPLAYSRGLFLFLFFLVFTLFSFIMSTQLNDNYTMVEKHLDNNSGNIAVQARMVLHFIK